MDCSASSALPTFELESGACFWDPLMADLLNFNSHTVSPDGSVPQIPPHVQNSAAALNSNIANSPGSGCSSNTECPVTIDCLLPCGWDPSICGNGQCMLDVEDCASRLPQSLPGDPISSFAPYIEPLQEFSTSPEPITQQVGTPPPNGSEPSNEATSKRLLDHNADHRGSMKKTHSIVEQKYRDKIKSKMALLQEALLEAQHSRHIRDSEFNTKTTTSKTKKADILTDALIYVRQTQQELQDLVKEVAFIKQRMLLLEKLVKCEDCSILSQFNRLKLQLVPKA